MSTDGVCAISMGPAGHKTSAKLAGALFTQFFAWNVTQSVRSSWKQSVVIHHDLAAHPLFFIDNWNACPNDQAFHIFRNGWINCRDQCFHAVLHL